mmetsp:Transcript_105221/g.267341  ORF Transcript_105221/g.267341 Transcript_105221/m.267341 type:complete len:201 (+) Transcript_105221:221-823(+)
MLVAARDSVRGLGLLVQRGFACFRRPLLGSSDLASRCLATWSLWLEAVPRCGPCNLLGRLGIQQGSQRCDWGAESRSESPWHPSEPWSIGEWCTQSPRPLGAAASPAISLGPRRRRPGLGGASGRCCWSGNQVDPAGRPEQLRNTCVERSTGGRIDVPFPRQTNCSSGPVQRFWGFGVGGALLHHRGGQGTPGRHHVRIR